MKSEEFSEAHLKIVGNAIDQVIDEYRSDNNIIFHSEAERAKEHFGIISKSMSDWKQSKECIVPECTNRSIAKSHTIPQGLSLSAICESGHLLTPEFDQKKGVMAMKRIGISRASTFPGFCKEHERLFEEYERQKDIDTEAHINLQTYRSACRELHRTNHIIENSKWITSYCRKRDERLLEFVARRAVEKGLPSDIHFTSLSHSDDPLMKRAKNAISEVQELSSHIENRILPALEKAVFSGCEDDIFVFAIDLDLQIPVALSGCTAYCVNDHGIEKKIYLIISVVPCTDHTILLFSGDIVNKKYIQLYISKRTSNIFSILSMIESWMVNGTDQWYLKPSVWNSLQDDRQLSILNTIIECKHNIVEEYELSIFDHIREDMLEFTKETEKPQEDSVLWQILESQSAKMI